MRQHPEQHPHFLRAGEHLNVLQVAEADAKRSRLAGYTVRDLVAGLSKLRECLAALGADGRTVDALRPDERALSLELKARLQAGEIA